MKKRSSLVTMKLHADMLLQYLEPDCERIEIAGSIRRKRPEVGDIEILCIPKKTFHRDLFGTVGRIENTESFQKKLSSLGLHTMNGPLFKQIQLGGHSSMGPTLDLFITTPEQWGVMFTLRTGSADFSHWLVKSRQHGGAMPSSMYIKDGYVWSKNEDKAIPTAEEIDVFNAIGLEYIPPEKREGPMPEKITYKKERQYG